VGTPVYAISDGSIVSVQNSDTYVKSTKAGDAFGKHVTLEFTYCGATLYALYGHLSEIWCEVGDPVSEGWMLGLTGTTGNAQGMKGEDQHLHFQIMTGNQINHGLADKVDPGAVLDPLPANQAIVDSDPVIQMLRHMIPEIIGHH
jgi:murein DD-endopeptidase MepM/ murein hydrolase activator NlpD